MGELADIVVGGLLMSAVALVGGVTVFMKPATLDRIVLPLVSLAAGTLLGGAFFHMIPEGMAALDPLEAALWITVGFASFLALEQFLHWHHSHEALDQSGDEGHGTRAPMTYLILIGDGVHNFLGGLGIASAFLIDPRTGIIAWFAAIAHEIPQELGDFGVLVHGGWPKKRALLWNFVSALTFPIGAILAYVASFQFEVSGLMLFAAGNFIYIASSDLIPEIKAQENLAKAAGHFALFAAGMAGLYLVAHFGQ
jgi:zinc and cadmium transporter